MDYDKKWLGLLAPLPANEGECTRRVLHDAPFEDWVEVRVVLGNGVTGLRIATAIFDADDRPGSVSDLVATEGGRHQETVGGRVAANGRIQGTYWLTENDQSLSWPLSETEEQGLHTVAAALRERYQPQRRDK